MGGELWELTLVSKALESTRNLIFSPSTLIAGAQSWLSSQPRLSQCCPGTRPIAASPLVLWTPRRPCLLQLEHQAPAWLAPRVPCGPNRLQLQPLQPQQPCQSSLCEVCLQDSPWPTPAPTAVPTCLPKTHSTCSLQRESSSTIPLLQDQERLLFWLIHRNKHRKTAK